MRKRILSFVLVISILSTLIAALPITANAATSGTCGANLTWTLDDAGTLTINGTGDMTNWVSSSNVPWGSSRDDIVNVVIDDGVTSISGVAFVGSTSLTSIRVDSNNLYFSSKDGVLFDKNQTELICYPAGKNNTSYIIPNSVASIESSAFNYCKSLTSVTIPDSVTSIGQYAFYNCRSLTSITISDSVMSIGYEAFTETGYYYNTDNWDNGVLYVGSHLITARKLLSDSYSIKSGTKTIAERAFYYRGSLISITIPDSVTSIGKEAFNNCTSLTSITIPDGVTSIGDWTFEDCTSLTSITIPDSVTNIGMYAFYNCRSLTSVTIPDSVTYIGWSVFDNCTSLTKVYITDMSAWYNINFGDSGANPLCNGANLYLNGELVTNLVIPDGVISIGVYKFNGCTSIASITIPDSVTSIGYRAFYNCESLTDVYYTGTEEEWNKISIGGANDYLKNATIHFNHVNSDGGKTEYEPTPDIDINFETDPSYMPASINKVTINGKGTAYGRFKILNTDGSIAKKKKVHYSVDGDIARTTTTDNYGYAIIEIPYITKSHDYTIELSGSGIKSCSEMLSVTVEPLHFKSGIETSMEKGVSVGAGFEAGIELGTLEAKAGVASVGAEGAAKNTLSLEQEFVNNKHKIEVSSKTNYSAAVDAKIGLFAEAKEKNSIGVSVSAAETSGEGSISGVFGIGFEDEDFNIKDSGDIENFARFMLSAFVGTQKGNVVAACVADALKAPVNSYELGTSISLNGGANLVAVEAGPDNVKGGVTVGGINGASIWTNSTKLMADNSIKYSSGVTTGSGTSLFNRNIKLSAGKASTGASGSKNFVKDNLSVSAKRDADFVLKEVSVSSTDSDESSQFLYKKTESSTDIITYKDDSAERVALSYDKLNDFTTGKKAIFSKSQLKQALETMTNSKESGTYLRTKNFEEEIGIDLSAKLKLGFALGGKIGIAGSSSYEYETESGIYENGTYYKQAVNDIGNDIDNAIITIDDMLEATKDIMNNILDSIWETAKGLVDQAVESGQALVKKATDKVTGWVVNITKPKKSVKTMSILAVEDEVSLFSTSSLATTIGDPYIISVADEQGNEITDFSTSPFILTLTYTDEQLNEAGVTDLENISVMRWDDNKNAYVKMGGNHDKENLCLTLEILKPGQYILAVDNCPPAITQFSASDNGNNPEISAIVSDMSGIDDFTFSIDDQIILNNNNFEEKYNYVTGEFRYETCDLTDGEHKATIYAKDTFGNEIHKDISFTVDTSTPEISDVTPVSQIITNDVSISANVENANIVLLNMEVTDVYGKTVQYSVDMVEKNGVYTADLPDAENGTSVNIWVSAYSEAGNGCECEKQQAIVMKSQDNAPVVAITSIADNSVTLKCIGFDNNENAIVYLALYDDNNKLVQVKYAKQAENIEFKDISESGYIRAFVWDGMTPLCKETELVEFVRFTGTRTTVSADGSTFTIKPVAIESGNTIILALYNDGKLVELEKEIYQENPITITTSEKYTNAKVMVWEDSESLKPVSDAENVILN